MSEIISIKIDWAEVYGWKCPFCGGEIDHLNQEDDEDGGYADDSYTCQDKGGEMCEHAYFMVRWSLTKRGDNGDAKTLRRWIDVEIPGKRGQP
jgi:hypothetical protein